MVHQRIHIVSEVYEGSKGFLGLLSSLSSLRLLGSIFVRMLTIKVGCLWQQIFWLRDKRQ